MPPASDGDRGRAARRRAAIRRHHPDVGGTAEELAAALAAFGTPRISVTVAPTIRGRIRGLVRHARRRRRRGRTSHELR